VGEGTLSGRQCFAAPRIPTHPRCNEVHSQLSRLTDIHHALRVSKEATSVAWRSRQTTNDTGEASLQRCVGILRLSVRSPSVERSTKHHFAKEGRPHFLCTRCKESTLARSRCCLYSNRWLPICNASCRNLFRRREFGVSTREASREVKRKWPPTWTSGKMISIPNVSPLIRLNGTGAWRNSQSFGNSRHLMCPGPTQ
jgi:hypothetical protein